MERSDRVQTYAGAGFLVLAIFSGRAFLGQSNDEKPTPLKQFRWALNINTILGVVFLLLTSVAQIG